MRQPRPLKIKEQERSDSRLSVSHLSDIKRCHIMTTNYGEITSVALNKIQVKKLVNWLNRWIEFRDALQKDGE